MPEPALHSNVVVEVLLEGDPELITSAVASATFGREIHEGGVSAERTFSLQMPEGNHQLVISQIFEDLEVVVPDHGAPAWDSALAISRDCFSVARLEITPGTKFKVTQRVRKNAQCEHVCAQKLGESWQSIDCGTELDAN